MAVWKEQIFVFALLVCFCTGEGLFTSRSVVTVLLFFFKGAVQRRPQLKEEDDDADLGEPPPFSEQQNLLVGALVGKVRYKCHSCEPPSCSNPTVCVNAVFCWKSRVRETTGKKNLRTCQMAFDVNNLIVIHMNYLSLL